jgi:uncharacterized membrane protein YgaE (UPF0421/DUF939 family)
MKSITTLNETRQQIQEAVIELFKGMTLKDRLLQGGLTAIQAASSAYIAYVIGAIMHSEQAVWAAITAIMVTQHSYTETKNLSRDQFVGAMIGGLLGFVGVLLAGNHYLTVYVMTVACTIIICWCLNVGSAARLGGATATIVMLFPGRGPLWDIPLTRLGEVTLGIICAMSVCWLISKIERYWCITRYERELINTSLRSDK